MKKWTRAALLGLGGAALAVFAARAGASNAQATEHLESVEAFGAAIAVAEDTPSDAGDELDGSDASNADANPDAGDAGLSFPSFAAEPFPEARTSRPTWAEWLRAPRVGLDGDLPDVCQAWRVREWMRVRCSSVLTLAIRLLGGDKEGVALKLDAWNEAEDIAPSGGELIFPIRRGDRRVFEWLALQQGYRGMTSMEPLFVLEESWLGEAREPTIF